MKRNLMFFIGLIASSQAFSADINCHGNVVMAMADHSGCQDSNGKYQMAFKTLSTSRPWMCAKTDLSSSLILSSVVAKRPVRVWISD